MPSRYAASEDFPDEDVDEAEDDPVPGREPGPGEDRGVRGRAGEQPERGREGRAHVALQDQQETATSPLAATGTPPTTIEASSFGTTICQRGSGFSTR